MDEEREILIHYQIDTLQGKYKDIDFKTFIYGAEKQQQVAQKSKFKKKKRLELGGMIGISSPLTRQTV